MEIKKLYKTLTQLANKYKYVLLVLLIGIVLMSLPDVSTKKDSRVEKISQEIDTEIATEDSLSRILGYIAGAGEVKVMLTHQKGEERLYHENLEQKGNNGSESLRSDTVIISDSQRNQSGLLRQVNPPTYMGAIVICEGADNPAVKLSIVDAVSKVTGLGANQISVLKMK